MDNLTHAMVGLAVGWAVSHAPRIVRRVSSDSGAPALLESARGLGWVGAAAANAPDLDVFFRSKLDPLVAIELHRHWTHSLVALPLVAALCAAACWSLLPMFRRQGVRGALGIWVVCLAAVVSHIGLDTITSYGTQVLQPLSRVRVSLDWMSIVDPLLTIPLVAMALGGLRARWRPRLAVLMASWAGFWISLGAVQHARAEQAARELIQARGQTSALIRLRVQPSLGNQVIWRSVYSTEDRLYADTLRVGWGDVTYIEGASVFRAVREDLGLEGAGGRNTAAERDFGRFEWFCDGLVYWVALDRRVLGDGRYSIDNGGFDALWSLELPAEDGAYSRWVPSPMQARGERFAELWALILGRDARLKKLPLSGARQDT